MKLTNSTYFNNSNSSAPSSRTQELTPVRVYDVILDESHPEYEKYGRGRSIGGVKYAPITSQIKTENINTLPFALPANGNIKTLPLKNEIVLLINAPDENSVDLTLKSTSTTIYYTSIISVWNHPHHNATPDATSTDKVELGDNFNEKEDINPLQPFSGDVIIEGRHGQSLRLSGAKHNKNIYTDQSNLGDPFTILSNGQKETTNGLDYIEEDINEDATSIYLMSNHRVPIEQSRDKNKSFKSKPVKADTYKGSQVVVNGGRLYFNSKEESILFSSKEAFGVTAKTVNLDGEEYVGIDASKIYLGEKALREEFEPVILGESMEGFLQTLLNTLQELSKDLVKAKTIDGKIIPNLILRGKVMEASIKGLQSQINPGGPSDLKSRKVYTE